MKISLLFWILGGVAVWFLFKKFSATPRNTDVENALDEFGQ